MNALVGRGRRTMAVFISYSHKDGELVGRIAQSLIKHDIKVWKDNWKTLAGDSFVRKIEAGIHGAKYFCVVLSKNSVQSKWVDREIATALEQERERGIKILPIRIDDCRIPDALSEILYHDLSTDFERGLQKLTAQLGKAYDTLASGRVERDSRYFIHYAIEREIVDGRFHMQIDVVAFDLEETYSVLAQFEFVGNQHATPERFAVLGVDGLAGHLLRTCAQAFRADPAKILLGSSKAVTNHFTVDDATKVARFDVRSRVKRLGEIGRGTMIFNLGDLFGQIASTSPLAADGEAGRAARNVGTGRGGRSAAPKRRRRQSRKSR
jgi:hypothetical protein